MPVVSVETRSAKAVGVSHGGDDLVIDGHGVVTGRQRSPNRGRLLLVELPRGTAALVLGPPRPVDTLIVGGGAIVRDGELRTAGEEQLAQDLERASRRLAGRMEAAR